MFKPIKTKKLASNFYVIRTIMVNFYIYDTGKNLIAFDSGINPLLVKKEMKKLGLDISKVSHIFLTHSDFDHVSGLNAFKNARVYLSKDEETLITHKTPRRGIMYNKKIKDYNFLDDSKEITIDNTKIKIISTPGHTVGSCMYIINNEVLMGGDTISIKNNTISNFSIIQNMNHKQNKDIVKQLKNENFFDKFKIIVSGHHGIIKR